MTPLALPDFRDACPSLAHHPGDCPASFPFLAAWCPGVLLAWYECPCGRVWETRWDGEAAGWPARREDVAA